MRYERLSDIVRLAILLHGSHRGVTLDEISEQFSISRRTAERMRDAVEAAFGPLLEVDATGDNRRHWRLQSTSLQQLLRVSVEELAELESAAASQDLGGLTERAETLRALARKLRAMNRSASFETFRAELEALMEAEGLAMRPGPRTRLEPGVLALVRDAIKSTRVLECDYVARSTGRRSRQRLEPYGVLYGTRPYLVGWSDWTAGPRLWRLANMSNVRVTPDVFERDAAFELRSYAERSFGTFQDDLVDVILRFDPDAAGDAATFLFHPSQSVTQAVDGSLTVRFRAGGLDEMCLHLFGWGESVTVVQPAVLRKRLADLCAAGASHHSTVVEAEKA